MSTNNSDVLNKFHIVVLVMIAGLILLTWMYPKKDTVGDQTIERLDKLILEFQNVAVNVDKVSQSQVALNDSLRDRTVAENAARQEAYAELLTQYQLAPANIPPATTPAELAPLASPSPAQPEIGNKEDEQLVKEALSNDDPNAPISKIYKKVDENNNIIDVLVCDGNGLCK